MTDHAECNCEQAKALKREVESARTEHRYDVRVIAALVRRFGGRVRIEESEIESLPPGLRITVTGAGGRGLIIRVETEE